MRGMKLLLICVMLVVVAGCGYRIDPMHAKRIATYGRIAIVCTPGQGADPQYANSIIKEANRAAPTRLAFLETVAFPTDITVDASTAIPKLTLDQAVSAYDGVVVLVYSYSSLITSLDITMIDTKSGESVWSHRMSKLDMWTQHRLRKHGFYTPTMLKKFFYGQR